MGRGEGGGRQRGELGATVCLGPALRADRGWGQVRVKAGAFAGFPLRRSAGLCT